MISMSFSLDDEGYIRRDVVKIKHKKYNDITIQISEVVEYYESGHVPVTAFIFEAITNDTDMIKYAHYIDEKEIHEKYAWFFE